MRNFSYPLLFGRQRELTFLNESWQSLENGAPHFIHVFGESGSGKSRLLYEFQQLLQPTPIMRLKWVCSPRYQHCPFYPLIEALKHTGQAHPDDTESNTLFSADKGQNKHLSSVISDLQGFSHPSSFSPKLTGTSEHRRQILFYSLVSHLRAFPQHQPL